MYTRGPTFWDHAFMLGYSITRDLKLDESPWFQPTVEEE